MMKNDIGETKEFIITYVAGVCNVCTSHGMIT